MIDKQLEKKLRAQYNPEGSLLRKGQLRMLEILKSVDSICQKHNIQYWLSSGTLLGAVRHGGFIPWDDDLDIEMMKKDYDKLIPILKKELPPQFILQDTNTEDLYPYLFVKVRDKNSIIKEDNIWKFKNNGVFIDIFPLENSFDILFKLSAYIYAPSFYLKFNNKIYSLYRNLLSKFIYPLFRFISKLNRSKTIHHTYGMRFYKKRYKNEIFPLKKIKFEDSFFFCPSNTDAYLKHLFGNYMNIPNEIEIHGNILSVK